MSRTMIISSKSAPSTTVTSGVGVGADPAEDLLVHAGDARGGLAETRHARCPRRPPPGSTGRPARSSRGPRTWPDATRRSMVGRASGRWQRVRDVEAVVAPRGDRQERPRPRSSRTTITADDLHDEPEQRELVACRRPGVRTEGGAGSDRTVRGAGVRTADGGVAGRPRRRAGGAWSALRRAGQVVGAAAQPGRAGARRRRSPRANARRGGRVGVRVRVHPSGDRPVRAVDLARPWPARETPRTAYASTVRSSLTPGPVPSSRSGSPARSGARPNAAAPRSRRCG